MKSLFAILLFVLASPATSHDTRSPQQCLAITECDNKIAEIPLPTTNGGSQGVPGKRGATGAKGDQGIKGEPGDSCEVEDQLAAFVIRLSQMEKKQNEMENEQNSIKKQLSGQSTDLPQQITDLKEIVMGNEEELNDTNKQVADIKTELTLGLNSLKKKLNATEEHLNQETAEVSRLEEELRQVQTKFTEEKLAYQAHVSRLEDELRKEKMLSQEFKEHLMNVTEKLTIHEEQHLNNTKEQVVQSDIVKSSCLDLVNAGKNRSGIYEVQPTEGSSTLQVFCDMEVDGGGWTLVASVHENNIDGKCTIGDNWSNDQGTAGSTSSSSWSNTRIFGNVEGATSDDYKNEAYFNLPASDVMIWHVPNNNPSSQWSDLASLKYYTNSSFLTQYGGNLRDLYKTHFPMERQEALDLFVPFTSLNKYMEKLEEQSSYIRSAIPSFYSYAYDDNANDRINDGGNDMYDTGNNVFVRSASSDWHRVVYDATHHDDGWSVTSSTQEHPFFTIMHIENTGGRESYFEIKVESGTGADGKGSLSSYTGDLSDDGYNLKYKTYNVYNGNGNDPSICEVYFVVYTTERGSVVSGSNFFTSNEWSSTDDNLINSMRVNNNPRNVLLGYTLFSKGSGVVVSHTEVNNAMTNILRVVARVSAKTTVTSQAQSNLPQNVNCSRIEESVVSPVIFHTGTKEAVTNRIPSAEQSTTTAGYIQLRALDAIGYPFAMCSGVRTDSCNPSSYCIGSISMGDENPRSCGDFTDGTSTFHNINSTILIFTRN